MKKKSEKSEEGKEKLSALLEGSEEGQLVIDVYQTLKEYVIKSTVAGVKGEDLDISIDEDMVTIRGKREYDETIEEKDYLYQECFWGSFSRTVILPSKIDSDKAEASFKNGVLTIRLPKIEEGRSRKIGVELQEQ